MRATRPLARAWSSSGSASAWSGPRKTKHPIGERFWLKRLRGKRNRFAVPRDD